MSNLKQAYSRPPADSSERFAESMAHLIQNMQRSGGSAQRFLDDIVQMIQRNYRIREVSIGLESPKDAAFKYVSFCGFRKDAEMALRRLSYSGEDFANEPVGRQISPWTWLFLSENKPFEEGEESTYNRPIMLERGGRQSPDRCLEADYFDTRIYDRRNKFIGWIEYSGTTDYSFPEIRTIKEIELIAEILAITLESRKQRQQMAL